MPLVWATLQLLTVAAVGFAAWRWARGWPLAALPGERGVLAGIFFCAASGGLVLALGAMGALGRMTVLAAAAAIAVSALPRWSGASPERPAGSAAWPAPALLRFPLALAVGLATPFFLRALLCVPADWDSLTYHLYLPARWIQEGALVVPLGSSFPYDFVTYFPAGYETVVGFLMTVARNDLFAQLLNLPLIAGVGWTTALLARRLGASFAGSTAAGLAVVTTPALLSWGATNYVEPLLDFALLAALLFTVASLEAPAKAAHWPALAAGLAAGTAAGSKYTALPLVALLALALSLAAGRRRGGARRAVFLLVAYLAPALALGGWWYIRNFHLTGNPLYPMPLPGLPGSAAPGLPWEHASVASRLGELVQSKDAWRVWLGNPFAEPPHEVEAARMALGWKLVWMAPLMLLGVADLVRRGLRRLSDRPPAADLPALVAGGSALVLLATYLASPYWSFLGWLQANVRFAVPAMAVAMAGVAAWLTRRGVGERGFSILALSAIGLDALALDLSVPGWPRAAVFAIAALSFSTAFLWPRLPPANRRMVAVTMAWSLLVVSVFRLPHRERSRYEQYASRSEVHRSAHRRFGMVARQLQTEAPGQTLTVAYAQGMAFNYLFVGPFFERPVLNSASDLGRERWRDALNASGTRLLLAQRREPGAAWPVEYGWAQELEYPLYYRDGVAAVFGVPSP